MVSKPLYKFTLIHFNINLGLTLILHVSRIYSSPSEVISRQISPGIKSTFMGKIQSQGFVMAEPRLLQGQKAL